MEEKIKVIQQKCMQFFKQYEYAFLLLILTILGVMIRLCFFNAQSGDYVYFLSPWFTALKENGGIKAIGMSLGDYTVPYIYILALLTYIPISSLYTIKAVSCLFDISLAFSVCCVVAHYTKRKDLGVLGYAVVMILPNVFLNSSSWGQCDSLFTSFCVWSVYALCKEKKILSVVLYAIAFSCKLQAIFLLPFFGVLWFKSKVQWWAPVLVPLVYVLFCVPAWIAGRDLGEMLCIYLRQTNTYGGLTLNAPTFVALFGEVEEYHQLFVTNGLIFLALAIVVILLYICARKVEWKESYLVDFAFLFALVVPFFLPRMHERYFYLADIFALVYVFLHPKRWYTFLLTAFCSFYVVAEYIYVVESIYLSLELVALIQLANVCLLCRDLWKDSDFKKEPLLEKLS